MQELLKAISLPMPFKMGRVNCYLLQRGAGFFLIDTGGANNRQELAQVLESAGCLPGLLKLILLTHGDFDHSGNAAHLRQRFGAPIAMHAQDATMGEAGDMFANRKKPNPLIRLLLPLFAHFGKAERFKPDHLLHDGQDLTAFGLEARILSIPGHSKGSIGILTASGELFCGDLLDNTQEPRLNALMDDLSAAQASLRILRSLNISTVYPGHGQPFMLEQVKVERLSA